MAVRKPSHRKERVNLIFPLIAISFLIPGVLIAYAEFTGWIEEDIELWFAAAVFILVGLAFVLVTLEDAGIIQGV